MLASLHKWSAASQLLHTEQQQTSLTHGGKYIDSVKFACAFVSLLV